MYNHLEGDHRYSLKGMAWRTPVDNALYSTFIEFGREVVFHGSQILRHSGRTDITPKEFFSLPNQFFSEDPNMVFLQMHHDSEFEVMKLLQPLLGTETC